MNVKRVERSILYKVITGTAISLLLIICLEIVFWGLRHVTYFKNNFIASTIDVKKLHQLINPTLDKFDSDMFCDFYHKKPRGQKLAAKLIMKDLGGLHNQEVLVTGGSVSAGGVCESGDVWVNYLKESYRDNKFINLSSSAMNSDNSVVLIEKRILKGKVPDIIIWNPWLTEANLQGSDLDLNYYKIRKKINFRTHKDHQTGKVFTKKIGMFLNRNSNLYRFLKNYVSRFSNRMDNLQSFSIHLGLDSIENDHSYFFPESFNQDEQVFSKYIFSNLLINMNRINNLSVKYNIKIVLILHPYVEGYYKDIIPYYDRMVEKIFIKELTGFLLREGLKRSWSIVNLQKGFRSAKLGDTEKMRDHQKLEEIK